MFADTVQQITEEEARAQMHGANILGYIMCSYNHLVAKLGEPNMQPSEDGKITTGWAIKFGRLTYTINDWKSTFEYIKAEGEEGEALLREHPDDYPTVEELRQRPEVQWRIVGDPHFDVSRLITFLEAR